MKVELSDEKIGEVLGKASEQILADEWGRPKPWLQGVMSEALIDPVSEAIKEAARDPEFQKRLRVAAREAMVEAIRQKVSSSLRPLKRAEAEPLARQLGLMDGGK